VGEEGKVRTKGAYKREKSREEGAPGVTVGKQAMQKRRKHK
jgi:hypothetical protein